MKKIIGINCYHADSSAAILINGDIVAAVEEERFKRIKHWAGIPIESIKFCLNETKSTIQEIDCICIGRNPQIKRRNKILFLIKNPFVGFELLKNRLLNRSDINNIPKTIEKVFGYCPPIKYIEHHRAHLASAYYSSPFQNSAIVSIDGSGDFSTVMIGIGKNSSIDVLRTLDFPVSVGFLYTAFTQFLGFPYYGDEYKVMGLSPYGEPNMTEDIRKIMWKDESKILSQNNKYFNFRKGIISYDQNIPQSGQLYKTKMFEKKFGLHRLKNDPLNERHKNIAASLQVVTEELIFHICNNAYKLTKTSNLCLAGGVAQNSVANGKILNNTEFKKLYIPSAGHDAGIAMGAAQYYYFNELKNSRVNALYNANLGPNYSNEQIKKVLLDNKLDFIYFNDLEELYKVVAKKISDGGVIGFFQGKSEFGPRALGSRSILADPRNSKAKELLNAKIKMRESFRPFAPSILDEFGSEYFEDYSFTPFMEKVLVIKEEKRPLIPSVTHVNGTGRLQSVRKDLRPNYHLLISKFFELTGVPILINTSFNENEPVVNKPQEAVDTYLRTDMDMLVLENYLVTKNPL